MLTEKRAADRLKMAADLIATAQAHGAVAYIDREWPEPRAIMVNIETPRGLRINIDFDGTSLQPDVFVMSWHIHHTSDTKLSPAFGDINPYHRRKATDVAYGFTDLCDRLARSLDMAAAGTAFA
jgi:hypothetical protein